MVPPYGHFADRLRMERPVSIISIIYLKSYIYSTKMNFSNQHRTYVDLGRTNRREVLAQITLRGPLSRMEIGATTNLTKSSVSRVTRELNLEALKLSKAV